MSSVLDTMDFGQENRLQNASQWLFSEAASLHNRKVIKELRLQSVVLHATDISDLPVRVKL